MSVELTVSVHFELETAPPSELSLPFATASGGAAVTITAVLAALSILVVHSFASFSTLPPLSLCLLQFPGWVW